MKSSTSILIGTAALLFSTADTMAGQHDLPRVHVICEAEVSEPVCTALVKALQHKLKAASVTSLASLQEVPSDSWMTIRFEQAQHSDQSLAGRLIWTMKGSTAEAGPSLELSFMDRALSAGSVDDFAKKLVAVSDISLSTSKK